MVDRSAQGELLRINFNISYPSLSCEFATLDVSDALGTVRPVHQNHTVCASACMELSAADRILSRPSHCEMCQEGAAYDYLCSNYFRHQMHSRRNCARNWI